VRISRKRATVSVVAVGLLMSLTSPSIADHWAWHNDPNDTEAATDIKRAAMKVPGHTPNSDKGKAKCRIKFFDPPPTYDIIARCEFDTKGGPLKDVQIYAYEYGGKFSATGSKYDGIYYTGSFPASWSRQDGDLILSIKRKHLKGRDSHMRWRAYASAHSGGVEDWAPSENGGFRFNWRT
jgi:hypothetical protein